MRSLDEEAAAKLTGIPPPVQRAIVGASRLGLRAVINRHQGRFNKKCAVIRELLDVDVVFIALFDATSQYFVAIDAIPSWGTQQTTRLVDAFCYTCLQKGSMYVPDAHLDERFSTNPLVVGHPFVRGYAGTVLGAEDVGGLGTMCALTLGGNTMDNAEIHQKIVKCGRTMADDIVFAAQGDSALERHAEALERLATSATVACCQDIVSVHDSSSKVRYLFCNESSSRWLDRTAGELKGRSFLELIHEEDASLARKHISRCRKGKLIEPLEHRLKHNDGHYIWVESTFMRQADEIVIVQRPIDERMRRSALERELIVMKARHDVQLAEAIMEDTRKSELLLNDLVSGVVVICVYGGRRGEGGLQNFAYIGVGGGGEYSNVSTHCVVPPSHCKFAPHAREQQSHTHTHNPIPHT
jgi:PAS domain S-box-containing protein